MVLETKRNPTIWKHFDLCLITDNHEMARCNGCGKFMSSRQLDSKETHRTSLPRDQGEKRKG
ncbi:putative transcription factor/ chromatin remodeling BED-type(Zn) family [Helianthus anomalus]